MTTATDIKSIDLDEPTIPTMPMTADEFEKWAFTQELYTFEWVAGEIVMMAPVSNWHNDLNRWLITLLSLFVEERGLGVIRYDMYVRMPERRRVPDLFVLKQENIERLTTNALNGPADIAMEIISPDSGARDWREKFLEYESNGVGEYWVFDPSSEVVALYALGEQHRFHPIPLKDGKLQSVVFPEFYIRPEWLWQTPLPPTLPLLREMGVNL